MLKVSDIMTAEVVFVTADVSVSQIAEILVKYAISGVPVLENEQLVGIVTDEDLVMREAIIDMPHFVNILDSVFYLGDKNKIDNELHKILATQARDLMTTTVVTIAQDASVQELATLMTKRQISPIPVVDEHGTLVGIVSRSDLVRLMVAENQVAAQTPEQVQTNE